MEHTKNRGAYNSFLYRVLSIYIMIQENAGCGQFNAKPLASA